MSGGSVRKRKSQWDSKEGAQLSSRISEDSDWHDPKWSASEANDMLKPKDSSERPSWESSQENYGQKDNRINRDLNEIPVTTRSWDVDKSYRVSPGYNGRGRQNQSRSPENSLSQSRRYRSRSRDRGQRRSRSRGRDRGDQSWSRSQSRSRSPVRDRRREPYGSMDRKSGLGLLSQPCRDFSFGNCRRGSECRFLHQDNLNQIDGGRSERDRSERDQSGRWRSRQEDREPMDYPPDKISDGYGNYDRRGGNAPSDHDRNRHPRRGGNNSSSILCKFFMAGKCNRDNCRFSHDGAVSGNIERSSRDDGDGYDSVDKNKLWVGPKWGDDANGVVSDVAQFTDWRDSNVGYVDYPDQRTAKKQNDGRWGPNLDEQNKSSDGPKLVDERQTNERWGHSLDNQSRMLSDEATERDGVVSPHWGYDDSGANVGPTLSAGGAKSFRRGELPLLVSQDFNSQTLGGISTNVAEQSVTQEASEGYENYNIQQSDNKRENTVIMNESNALNGVGLSGNVTNPDIMAGLSFNQNGDNMDSRSSSLIGTDPSKHMITQSPPNRPLQMFSHSNPQNQNEIPSYKPFELLQSQVPQMNSGIPQNVSTSDQLAETTNLSVSLTQIFGNGQQLPQLYAALNPPNSVGTVPSLSTSATFAPPLVSLDQPDPATKSKEQCDTFGDRIEPNKPGDETHEQKIPIPSKPIQNSEVKENEKITAEKFKQEQENIHQESVNEDGKVGEGNSGKDEKDMRLFKIALVEFVKEILKPTWKEGQMSREVHKTIVKKVVDKVTTTIQGVHVPKTQEKIDQYLSYSKPKITKLVQAYVERFLKNETNA